MSAGPILLIDDHALFRSGLSLVLQASLPDIGLREAGSMEEALAAPADAVAPCAVLLDIQLRGLNGLDGLGLIRRRWPGAPVIMLSASAEPAVVRESLDRGAYAYVSKADSADAVLAVLGQALRGDPASAVGGGAAGPVELAPRLSPRQAEILDLVCQGLSNKAIARRLTLSEFTVRGHVQAVLRFLGVASRSQAVAAARARSLVL